MALLCFFAYKQLVFIALEICYSSKTKTANSQIYKAIEYVIAVDADTSDWQGILFETINKKTHLWVGQGMSVENWEGLNDLSFTWRAAWKSNKIYFLFVVTDNKISPFNRPNSWLNDCVEIPLALEWEYSSNPGGSIKPGKEEHISPNLAIREGDWKLLINTDSTDVMLFNLKNDPGETNNLAEKKSQKAQNMAAKVLAWRRSMPVEIPQ